jgi:hypothetical protein
MAKPSGFFEASVKATGLRDHSKAINLLHWFLTWLTRHSEMVRPSCRYVSREKQIHHMTQFLASRWPQNKRMLYLDTGIPTLALI